jgi:transcriptional regulator with XRE-family HTH domain
MGKAGEALRLVLETYGISQNKLAVILGIERGSVYRWVHEIRDPTAETVREIVKALQGIEPAAAEKFIELYLGDLVDDGER